MWCLCLATWLPRACSSSWGHWKRSSLGDLQLCSRPQLRLILTQAGGEFCSGPKLLGWVLDGRIWFRRSPSRIHSVEKSQPAVDIHTHARLLPSSPWAPHLNLTLSLRNGLGIPHDPSPFTFKVRKLRSRKVMEKPLNTPKYIFSVAPHHDLTYVLFSY